MSVHQSNIAMLRHLGAALVDQSDRATRESDKHNRAKQPDMAIALMTIGDVVGRIGRSCVSAATSLQNDADALARGAEG